MCFHATHYTYPLCGHSLPIPSQAPFFIPPRPCSEVADHLRYYHTQPDRTPTMFPMPFPQHCAPLAAEDDPTGGGNCVSISVPGLCLGCVEAHRKVAEEKARRIRDMVVKGPREEEEQQEGGSEWGEGAAMEVSSGQYQLVRTEYMVGRNKDGEEERRGKTSPTIVETPEVVGAWWQEGNIIQGECYCTAKDGRRKSLVF